MKSTSCGHLERYNKLLWDSLLWAQCNYGRINIDVMQCCYHSSKYHSAVNLLMLSGMKYEFEF